MTGGQILGAFIFAVIVLLLIKLVHWVTVAFTASGHWVYEIDTADGALLYVGECADVAARMRRHVQYQRRLPHGHRRRWWDDADPAVQANLWPSRTTWYHSKEIAKAEERRRVRERKPLANLVRYKGVDSGGV